MVLGLGLMSCPLYNWHALSTTQSQNSLMQLILRTLRSNAVRYTEGFV
ncbi:hypothetical protein B0G77_0622 [Paraburkholderia sp. BL10I2N1]|nr:hypothetical protein B0G77_0622 [Paraburkholderia sp. BL10I2N1]